MSYRFLEHVSDLIIQGENTTFEKALQDVAQGMTTQMGGENAEEKETLEAEVREENREDLVVAALTAIISECEAEIFTPKKITVEKIEGGVRIKISGEKKPHENVIKAVTYHGLKIEHDGKWKITVLFDI